MVGAAVDGRKVRAAERREETRERLLAAALEVFAEQGYHAGTTKAITQRAGVAEGLLFHYFPTKADLMIAVLARDPLAPRIRRQLAEVDGVPLVEALPRLARDWLRVIRAHCAVTAVLLQEGHGDPRVQAAIVGVARETTALIADYLAARVRTGELRAIDPPVAARLLLQALFGLTMLCADAPAADPDAVLDRELDLLLHGMLRPADAAREARSEVTDGPAGAGPLRNDSWV
jgi:AcrR family transcriptional regulator